MTYTLTLQAATKAELAEQIAAVASEWAHDTPDTPVDKPDTPVDKPDTPTKTQAHPNVGSEDDQPELPIEEAPKPKATRKKAKPKAKPEPEPETKTEAEPEPQPEPDAADPQPVSIDTLRKQLMAHAEQVGNTQAKALVAEWGKVSAVPDEERNRIFREAGGAL